MKNEIEFEFWKMDAWLDGKTHSFVFGSVDHAILAYAIATAFGAVVKQPKPFHAPTLEDIEKAVREAPQA